MVNLFNGRGHDAAVSSLHLQSSEMASVLSALDRSQAVIQFKPDGTIIHANANFLSAMGYQLAEITGKHHRIFVDPAYASSKEYSDFWADLASGSFKSEEFKRHRKDGSEVWIQASYNPVKDKSGRVVKVIKYATDITEQILQSIDHKGQVAAVERAQAVIEFELDGTIITANQNFLDAMGYTLAEIQGEHHSMFADTAYAASQDYKDFWKDLAQGKFNAGQYKRFGKGGKEVWIQASYNPILDLDGNPVKVVKFATDVTEQVLQHADFKGQIEAVHKSQAVIEFELDGTIITANDNFLSVMGYSLTEVQGRHHSMFAEAGVADTQAYKEFWEKLGKGIFDTGEYKRIGKGGTEVWIQASYNPILDPEGNPFKVVKYATDITDTVHAREESVRVGALVDSNLEQIVQSVGGANQQAASAASASEETAVTVQSVAAAVEQLQASSQEIARNMETSRGEIELVADGATTANASAMQLSAAADAMTSIVDVITDIAGQINLLALNATIESARAGEAGKGFAVVASEVKSLAGQVANATTQISQEITGMQQISGDVASQLGNIRDSVEAVKSSVTVVASAVEEQAASSQEITHNMQSASTAVDDINSGLSQISVEINNANTLAIEGTELYSQLNRAM